MSAKSGSLSIAYDRKNCPLYGVAGCPLSRGCLSIEVNGRTVGTCPLYHGYPLFRGVR